jgi:hypothetical protein
MGEIDRALEGRSDADDIVDEMLAMGTVQRGADGVLHDTTGDHLIG